MTEKAEWKTAMIVVMTEIMIAITEMTEIVILNKTFRI